MKSLADKVIRLEHEPSGACSAAVRPAVAVLFIFTGVGCLAGEGLGVSRSEAAPVTTESEAQPAFASTARPAAPAPQSAPAVSAPDPASSATVPLETGTAAAENPEAEVPLPDNASAELRALAPKAIAGQPNAEHDLGTFFALGIGVPRDLEQAAYWYRRAADHGVANAAYNLGVLLERGLGVPRDPAAAVACFREAAQAGHAGALNALGLAYLNGSGVARDPTEALVWFQQASAGGNPRGAYNLAKLYESGELGTPDPQAAAGWYRVAADAGNDQAKAALARLQAASGTGASTAPRTGFVSLAPGAGLPVAAQATTAAGPEGILDDLAAQMTASEAAHPSKAAKIPVAVITATRATVAPEQPVTAAQIKEIQQLLARLNLYAGNATGRLGRKTRAAIAAFQQSQDLPVTRWPSVALLEALRTAALAAPAEDPVALAPAPEPRVTAAEIEEIQQLLARLDFDAGRADGQMGRKTRAAIADFQQSQDLPVTRRPSAALLEALRTAVQAAPAEAPVALAPAPEARVTATQIKEIQQLLGRLDFDAGRADGQMGRKTRAAIAAFQQSQDLPVTRRPSAALLEALRTATLPPGWD
ncbi:MAG: peptidoglycan-binding protein [Inquilinus sp.]|uniref:peptidoglycan-binding protein n=1 Tax=Inquilinus sp. TaxID=1932117 RepID=UPI003F306CC9